ncbi:MAG TPA: hypothetical protein V6C58_08470 [Allocoleopsis sp.]
MNPEVTQWLAEIKTLKQKIAELEQQLQAALVSEANWRQMYTTEAQQRRTENKLAQQQSDNLKGQLRQLQESSITDLDDYTARETIEQQLSKMHSHKELKAKLVEVMLERDRLKESLKNEQASHAQTRKSLTTVIGDTIDKLTKERSQRRPEETN